MSFSCNPLECSKCEIEFNLKNLDTNNILKSQNQKKINFEYSYNSSSCFYYELEAFIKKENFGVSDRFIISKEAVLPNSQESIQLDIDYLNQRDIAFDIKAKNFWTECSADTKIILEILKPNNLSLIHI